MVGLGCGGAAPPRDAGASDASDSSDAAAGASAIAAWLAAIGAQEAQYCRCGYALMEYASAEECARAHAIGPEARGCAERVYPAFAGELAAATECSTRILDAFAACMGRVADCGADALNACEAARAEAASGCEDAPPDPLEAFFAAIGACAAGPAGACPDEALASGALGEVWAGNTFGRGDDVALDCAAGRGAPDVALAWTAPAAGTYAFDTFGSAFDTTLAVLDGCGGAELACGEDAGERRTSSVEVRLDAGQAVVVIVDGFNELATGAAVLHVRAM